MSKEETVRELKERGYNACLSKGIVTVLYKNVEEYNLIKNPVIALLRNELGYEHSFAIRHDSGESIVKGKDVTE